MKKKKDNASTSVDGRKANPKKKNNNDAILNKILFLLKKYINNSTPKRKNKNPIVYVKVDIAILAELYGNKAKKSVIKKECERSTFSNNSDL